MTNPLLGDECIYVEAVPGDGGIHTDLTWWLSPDIILTGPTPPDQAQGGVVNTVQMRVHRKEGCMPRATTKIVCEAYVGCPGLTPSASSLPIDTEVVDASAVTPAGLTISFDWKPSTSTTPPDPMHQCPDPANPGSFVNPNGPGHRCLITRCYPASFTPSTMDFFLPDDPHAAQHNISIVGAAMKPGAKGQGEVIEPNDQGLWEFPFQAANVDRERPERVSIHATVDLRPSDVVLGASLPWLQRTEGFVRIAEECLPRFAISLPDFPKAIVSDHSQPASPEECGDQSYEAEIELGPGQITNLVFQADLSQAQLGDAYIHHLRQIGSNGKDQGGLTLVYVLVA